MKSYPFSQNQRPTLPPPFLSFSEDSLLWCFYVAMTFTSKRIQQVLLSLFKSSQGVGALFSLHPLSLSLSLSVSLESFNLSLSLSHIVFLSFCLLRCAPLLYCFCLSLVSFCIYILHLPVLLYILHLSLLLWLHCLLMCVSLLYSFCLSLVSFCIFV